MSKLDIYQDDKLVTIAVDGADDNQFHVRRVHAVITDVEYDLYSFSLYYEQIKGEERIGSVSFVDCSAECSINEEDFIGKEVFLIMSDRLNELLAIHVVDTGEQKDFVDASYYGRNFEMKSHLQITNMWSRMWMRIVWLNVGFSAFTLLLPEYRTFFACGLVGLVLLVVSSTLLKKRSVKAGVADRYNSFKLQTQKILDRVKDDSTSMLMFRKINVATKPHITAP